MGIALWIGCSGLAFLSARAISSGRSRGWIGELIACLAAGIILGAAATLLDFGGWNEPDWRAGLFVFFGSASVIAVMRIIRLSRADAESPGRVSKPVT